MVANPDEVRAQMESPVMIDRNLYAKCLAEILADEAPATEAEVEADARAWAPMLYTLIDRPRPARPDLN